MQRPARGADPAARVQRDRHQQDGVVPVPHARLRLVVERTEFANGDTQQRQQVLVQREADRGTHDLKGGIVRHRSDVRVPQVAGHLRARLQARGALPGEELLRSGLAEAGAVGGGEPVGAREPGAGPGTPVLPALDHLDEIPGISRAAADDHRRDRRGHGHVPHPGYLVS